MQELSINSDPPIPQPRCLAIRSCCANPYCQKTRQLIQTAIEVLTATTEGAVIGYTIYRVFDNGSNILDVAGDVIVALFASANGLSQLLFRIKPSQRASFDLIANRGAHCNNFLSYTTLTIQKLHFHFVENFNSLHRAKLSLLGGLMGSKFLSDFVPRDWRNVLANSLITTTLTGTHLITQIAHERGRMETPKLRKLRNGIKMGFVFLMSLGISDEIVALTKRFGTEDLGLATRLAIYLGVSAIILMAYIGFNHLKTPSNSTGEITAARILRSIIYGSMIAFFAIPFLLDFKNEVTQSLSFTAIQLGLIFLASNIQGIASGFLHFSNAQSVVYPRTTEVEIMLDDVDDTQPLRTSVGSNRNILMPAPKTEEDIPLPATTAAATATSSR